MTLLDLLSSINKRITDMMIPNRSSKNPLLSPSAEFGQPSTTFESRFTSQLRTSKGGVRNEPELASSNTSYEAARDIEYQDEDRTDETATEQTLQRNPISFVAKNQIAPFGPNYAKFWEAFGFRTTQINPRSAATVVPAKRRASTSKNPAKKVKLDNCASSEHVIENRALTPTNRPSTESKVQIMRPKGSGIYKTGTWEYITDEEKEDEKIETVVKEISAITEAFSQKPAKITRRSYHEMKSKLGGKSPAPRPSTKSRISGARVGGNKTARPSSIVTLKCSFIPQENDNVLPIPTANPSPTLSKRQEAPFTQIPPASHDSMPAPDGTTLSTSASTIPQLASNPELSTRPKLSWNAIVYGVMTNSETQDMSLSEIVEGIKERHPFYRSPDQAETLKSSPRNPLYHHPAFFKTIRPDGSGAWGLKPGAWYDEKTKKLLTTGPPNINVSSSSDPAERMTEKDGSKDIAGEPPTSSLDEVEPPSELGDRPSSPSESFRKSGGSELNEAPDNITHQKTELGRTSSVEQERELSSVIQANTTASPQEAEAIRMIQQPTILPSFESLVSRLNDQRYFEDAVHRDLVDTSMTD